ncbi:MAG: TonB-dependent receptor [Leptolyngbya sp. LCM1.Bin17]|nr:MAG: TonB-dependent receptor [Leptolyngbya sp. LCM1.Bin17]
MRNIDPSIIRLVGAQWIKVLSPGGGALLLWAAACGWLPLPGRAESLTTQLAPLPLTEADIASDLTLSPGADAAALQPLALPEPEQPQADRWAHTHIALDDGSFEADLGQLQAQEDVEPIRIQVIERILDQPVFSPFRREGTVREASQPVYVINREQIEAQGARTVQEALRYLPGILSDGTTGGQLGSPSSQFIRGGSSSQTLILIDGRPINEIGTFGAFDLSRITTNAVEQIEVLPGGGSVLYGSNAIGGVINIITRRPLTEPGEEFSVSAAVGSFGFNDQTIQLRGADAGGSWVLGFNRTSADNNFPFRLTTTDFDGTRANADVLYNNVNVGLVGNINDRNRLRFGLLFLSKDQGAPGGVPVPGSGSGGFNNLSGTDRQYSENWLIDATYEADLGQGDDSQLTARIFADLLDFTFNSPVPNNPFASPIRDEVSQSSIGAQVQHAWQFAPNQNITYGADYRTVQADNNTVNLLTNLTTENYSDRINQGSLFARYQAAFTDRFSANLGVRQDFNDLADGAFTSFSLGTQVAITESTNFRANLARNFRVPTLGDLFFAPFNNPDLRPESGLSFDVGFDQQLGDRGLWRFTFFRNDIRDAISFDLATFTPQNIGQVKAIGIETEVSVQVVNNLFAFANYTWNQPTIQAGPNPADNGNLLPFTHADSFNLGLAYETPQGIYGALFLRHISDFFVDRRNSESLAGRTTLDAKLRLPLTQTLALNASVDNLFDTQFELFPGFPGVGRSFQVGIRGQF